MSPLGIGEGRNEQRCSVSQEPAPNVMVEESSEEEMATVLSRERKGYARPHHR